MESCTTSATVDAAILFSDLLCLFSDIDLFALGHGPSGAIYGIYSLGLSPRRALPVIHRLDLELDPDADADGAYDLLRLSGSLDGALTEMRLSTACLDHAVPFFTFLPEARRSLVNLKLYAFAALSCLPETSPCPLQLPHFPALRTLELPLDCCDTDADLDRSRQHMRNVVNVYTHLLSTPASFPVLSTITFRVVDAANAQRIFSNHQDVARLNITAALACQLWDRFGRVIADLPAIKRVNFDLCDKLDPTRIGGSAHDCPRMDWRTEVYFKMFLYDHVPALCSGDKENMCRIYRRTMDE